jgi:NADPH:quinone reductase-like Zn-dependent oxidoreductase
MKAVQFHAFGGPEVLKYEDAPRPVPAPGQVLLRVRAVDMTPLCNKMRAGEVAQIYPPWFPDVPGYCMAGVVEAVGQGVVDRHPGEEVYASVSPARRRGFAEYAVVEAHSCRHKPDNLSFEEAAGSISGLLTAHNALFGTGGLVAGQTVLIHGGSGGVGSFAVQLARQAGARIVATASAANQDRLWALGADVAVDYRSQRFEDHATGVDLVIDTLGGETRARSFPLLRRGGTLVTLVPPAIDAAVAAAHEVRAVMIHGHPAPGGVLEEARALFEKGLLHKSQIALVLPLAQAAEAARQFKEVSGRGRVVLSVP